jgi:peroxiredoxin
MSLNKCRNTYSTFFSLTRRKRKSGNRSWAGWSFSGSGWGLLLDTSTSIFGDFMKRLCLTVVVLSTSVLLATLACKKVETPLPAIGNSAPSFTVMDVQGKNVSLSDFSGKIVILDFWATWCAPCKASTRELEKLHETYKERGVVVLGLSMDVGKSAVEQVREFAGKNGLTYTMLMDDGRMSKAYAIRNVPAAFILDKQHRIIKIYPGYLPGLGTMIGKELEGLLQERVHGSPAL